MRLTRIFVIGLVSLACAANAQPTANTNRQVRSLTLEECTREALAQNLRIQIRRFDPNISRFALAANYGVYDPVFDAIYNRSFRSSEGRFDPTTGVESRPSTTDSDAFSPGVTGYLPYTGLRYNLGGDFTHNRGAQGGGSFDNYVAGVDIALVQPLLKNFWTDASRLTIQLSKLEYKRSELALEEEVRIVVRDVEVAYYELMFAQDDVKVQEKAVELANTLAAQNLEKEKIGVFARLDARQSESQAATALADLIQAQRRLGTAQSTLINLLTDSYEAWINTTVLPSDKLVAVPEPLNLLESWTAAMTKRPDYKQLLLQAEQRGIEVKFRQNQLFPELNVLGGYGRNGLDSSFEPIPPFPGHQAGLGGALDDIAGDRNPKWNVGFEVRIPFSNRAERNRLKGAKETQKQIALEVKKLQQDIQVDVDIAMGSARGSYAQVGATHQARLFAEEALSAEQTKLENGKSTSFQVLQLQKDLTKARSDEIRALADYNESLTVLFYRDGTLLERRKIGVKVK